MYTDWEVQSNICDLDYIIVDYYLDLEICLLLIV